MLDWQIGIEIELIAPPGLSRSTLAKQLCPKNGRVERFFHLQSELSQVSTTPVFDNLTPGFAVFDDSGKLIAKCVDDITLKYDCQHSAPPKSGWYRLVSDDRRFLELIIQQCDPNASLSDVLNPLAYLFGTKLESNQGKKMFKAVDRQGDSIAIATSLPGERERPCEIVTPILRDNYRQYLSKLLATATKLDFSIPQEGATHIHFDAAALADTRIFCNLVNLFWTYGKIMRCLVGTNPHCRRLGQLPQSLWLLVNDPTFQQLPWSLAVLQLKQLQLTKYCDFNFKNLVYFTQDKYTLEVRIFPVWLEAESIVMAAELIVSMLQLAVASPYLSQKESFNPDSSQVHKFLSQLPLSDQTYKFWVNQARSNF
ncbi:MAG: amidoligase family protein [Cyanobacteria bacterium J06600_6]